jgi:hypothetical protein
MPPHVLVAAAYDSPEELAQDRVAGRQMLRGLDRAGLSWRLHQPWHPDPGLDGFDAVLFWSYRWQRNNYLYYARKLEQRARAAGLPVVNSVAHADAPHSWFLRTWGEHGVSCARCRRFAYYQDFGLDYPLLIRRDGVHMGQDLHLVHTPEEARALIDRRLRDLAELPRRERPKGQFDLAIEFVDTADERGIYRKWRSYVIGGAGGQVIPRLMSHSHGWLVNFGHLIESAEAMEEDRAFVRGGEPRADLLREAARWTGSDIVALDYAKRRDGTYVFWEANRHFLMLGDKGYEQPEKMQAATGRTPEEREAEDELVGRAIADLVLRRAERAHP